MRNVTRPGAVACACVIHANAHRNNVMFGSARTVIVTRTFFSTATRVPA